jgi:hypothetical protein
MITKENNKMTEKLDDVAPTIFRATKKHLAKIFVEEFTLIQQRYILMFLDMQRTMNHDLRDTFNPLKEELEQFNNDRVNAIRANELEEVISYEDGFIKDILAKYDSK